MTQQVNNLQAKHRIRRKIVAGWHSANPLRWCKIVLHILSIIYTSGMISLLFAHAYAIALPPFVALASVFTPFLFLPIIFFLSMSVWLRAKPLICTMLVLFGVFLWQYYPIRFRQHATNNSPQTTFTVITHNLGLDRISTEKFVAAVNYEQVDIIALQELTPATAEILETELNDYPYRVFSQEQISTAIFSRYPITEYEHLYYSEGPRYLYAQIEWEGTPLHIFAIHPQPAGLVWYKDTFIPIGVHDEAAQERVLETEERMSALTGPRLLLGDFNMSEYTYAYAKLSDNFFDVHRETGRGLGFTFPKGLHIDNLPIPGPFIRLDYIFYSAELEARQSRVQCNTGSDHCYLVAELHLYQSKNSITDEK